MSGYTGLDGKMIMAGSPDLDMIFADCDIPSLLRGKGSIIVGLERLRIVATEYGHHDLKKRCDLVEALIVAAQRLITWPTGHGTRVEAAEAAVAILQQDPV